MNILHVIPSLDPRSGGPARAIRHYVNLAEEFGNVTLAATNEGFEDQINSQNLNDKLSINSSVNILLFSYLYSHSYKFSWSMLQWLNSNLNQFDLAHLHAAFSVMTTITAFKCRRNNIPYVFRPLGTLSEFSLAKGFSAGKKIYFNMFEKQTLLGSRSIHATSPREKDDLNNLAGTTNNVSVIPIPEEVRHSGGRAKSKKRLQLGFLSRIHPKKNMETLFEALAGLTIPFHLHIAGSGQPSYIESLKDLSEELEISKRVTWCGFINDEQKKHFFDSIDFFILPSKHENFGIAVIEALAYGRPVIISNQVDTSHWVEKYECGMITSQEKVSIKEHLENAHYMPVKEYATMSSRAVNLVENEFSNERIKEQLKALYDVEY